MQNYLDSGKFLELPRGYMLVRRILADGRERVGLIGAIDLEQYDFSVGSGSPVRATEGTVLSRIPPRVEVRKDAPLELPHIMILIDDPQFSVIEPLLEKEGRKIYDFELMEGGGHISGTLFDGAVCASVEAALRVHGEPAEFEKRCGVSDKAPLIYAVGDGNHSLATAKTCWENIKAELLPSERADHPARYALCELVNLHSPALSFEPIHRVLFDVDTALLAEYIDEHTCAEGEQKFEFITADGEAVLAISQPTSNLAVGSLEELLGAFMEQHGGRIDYVHGDDVARELGRAEGSAAFLLPAMRKDELFPTVVLDGSLPRKTFSMGHAADKRFYLEARRIKK